MIPLCIIQQGAVESEKCTMEKKLVSLYGRNTKCNQNNLIPSLTQSKQHIIKAALIYSLF